MIDLVLAVLFFTMLPIYAVWIIALLFLKREKHEIKSYPSITVILPAHDEEEYIRETLDAVYASDYPSDLEVIVINDGSTDRTKDILTAYKRDKPSLVVIETDHVGKANGINQAAEQAKGDVFLALDADSILEKDALKNMVAPFVDENVAATSGVIRARLNSNFITWFQDYEYILTSAWRRVFHNLKSTYILPGFAAFRRTSFNEVGGFRPDTLSEDFEIGLRLQKKGYKLEMTDAVIHTNVPQTLRLLARQRIRWGAGTIQVIKKHKNMLFSTNFTTIGWLGMPTQLYWIIHGLINLPYTAFQIVRGYNIHFIQKGELISQEAFKYFFGWLTTYGILEYAYKVFTGQWVAGKLFTLVILIFTLSTLYAFIALLKISHTVTIRNIISIFFFFPFSLFVLAMYCIPVFSEVLPFGKKKELVNIWEKK